MFSAVNMPLVRPTARAPHFYTIDARSQQGAAPGSSIINRASAFDAAGPEPFRHAGRRHERARRGHQGQAIHNENSFVAPWTSSAGHRRNVLGYTPSNQSFDGKFRKIDVSNVTRPGLKSAPGGVFISLEPARCLNRRPAPDHPPSHPWRSALGQGWSAWAKPDLATPGMPRKAGVRGLLRSSAAPGGSAAAALIIAARGEEPPRPAQALRSPSTPVVRIAEVGERRAGGGRQKPCGSAGPPTRRDLDTRQFI